MYANQAVPIIADDLDVAGGEVNWRDQIYQDETGLYKFLTTLNITNPDLDEEYCRFGFIHEAVNSFVSMGVKVGTA